MIIDRMNHLTVTLKLLCYSTNRRLWSIVFQSKYVYGYNVIIIAVKTA